MVQASRLLRFARYLRSSAVLAPEYLRPTSPWRTRKHCFRARWYETMARLELAHRCCHRWPPRCDGSSRQGPQGAPRIQPEFVERLDRKSTRLNSSHTVISYAVFCLKKKNNTVTSQSR